MEVRFVRLCEVKSHLRILQVARERRGTPSVVDSCFVQVEELNCAWEHAHANVNIGKHISNAQKVFYYVIVALNSFYRHSSCGSAPR